MFVVALGFHFIQNSGAVSGGSVPWAKSGWLFTVLFYWYVMPAVWLFDKSLSNLVRLALGISLLNMLVRALLELPLMYMTGGWLHAYGIGHDVFSMVLSLMLLVWLSNKQRITSIRWVQWYLMVSAILFSVEGVFATYLRSVTDANGLVFFLPTDNAHSMILFITGLAVLLTWLAIFVIVRLSNDPLA